MKRLLFCIGVTRCPIVVTQALNFIYFVYDFWVWLALGGTVYDVYMMRKECLYVVVWTTLEFSFRSCVHLFTTKEIIKRSMVFEHTQELLTPSLPFCYLLTNNIHEKITRF